MTAHMEGTFFLLLISMSDTPTIELKSGIRDSSRLLRRDLSPAERGEHNDAINLVLLAGASRLGVRSIAAFWPFDGEPDLRASLNEFASNGVRIALPVIDEKHRENMSMHEWTPDSKMKKNRFGIEEPVETAQIDILELDLILIPLVAWDSKGNRLGMGAGFYDRLLEPLSSQASPIRTGIAYADQEVEIIPVEKHDIPLHGLINENGWTVFKQSVQAAAKFKSKRKKSQCVTG